MAESYVSPFVEHRYAALSCVHCGGLVNHSEEHPCLTREAYAKKYGHERPPEPTTDTPREEGP